MLLMFLCLSPKAVTPDTAACVSYCIIQCLSHKAIYYSALFNLVAFDQTALKAVGTKKITPLRLSKSSEI